MNKTKSRPCLDAPFQLKPPVQLNVEGIKMPVDDLEDIAANKILALLAEPRDFINIYFLSKEYFEFKKWYKWPRKKIPALIYTGLLPPCRKRRE